MASAQGGNGTAVRATSEQRRGNESMGNYYRRTGVSMLGQQARTRGTSARVTSGRNRG